MKEKVGRDRQLRVKNKILNHRGKILQREANGEGDKVRRRQSRAKRHNGIVGSMKVVVNVEKIRNAGIEENMFIGCLSRLRGKRN